MREDVYVGKFKAIYRPDVPGDWTVIEEHCKRSDYSNHLQLTEKDRWLDLGSHIGCFALDVARIVEYVHCVEAEHSNVRLALRNVSLNPYANIVVEHGAVVGDNHKDDVVLLHLAMKSHSNSLHPEMYNLKYGKIGTIEVPAVKAQDLIDKHNLNKIKLDIEGAEYDVVPTIDWSKIDEFIMEAHTQVPKADVHGLRSFFEEKGFSVLQTTSGVPAPNFLLHGVK